MTLDVVLALTTVRKHAELRQRREHLRPEVAVVSDDVASVTVHSEPRDLFLLVDHHHADRWPTDIIVIVDCRPFNLI